METFGVVFMMFAFFFLAILAVLWLILPFAVFGVKDRLDKIHRGIEATNVEAFGIKDRLDKILREIEKTYAILEAVHDVRAVE